MLRLKAYIIQAPGCKFVTAIKAKIPPQTELAHGMLCVHEHNKKNESKCLMYGL